MHRQVALADMQVGAADGAGQDLDQQFAGSRAGTGFSTYLSGLVSIGPGWPTTHACIVSELPTVIPNPYHDHPGGHRAAAGTGEPTGPGLPGRLTLPLGATGLPEPASSLFFTFWLSGLGLFLRGVWDSPAGERIRVHPIALAWLCGAAAVRLFVLAWRTETRNELTLRAERSGAVTGQRGLLTLATSASVPAQRQVYGYTFLISPGSPTRCTRCSSASFLPCLSARQDKQNPVGPGRA